MINSSFLSQLRVSATHSILASIQDNMPSFAITPITRQAVELRLEELEHTKQSFEQRYLLDAKQSEEPSVIRRIERLLEDIENLDPKFDKEDGIWTSETTKRCIEQARDGGIVTENKLLKLEKALLDKLSRFRNRMEVSCLHSRLMKEAIDVYTDTTATRLLEDMAVEDDFEVVDDDREDALKDFVRTCSQQTTVDSSSIDEYLSGLFAGEEDHLQAIRNGMRAYGSDLSNGNIEVDQETLKWIITDLIRSEHISQERRETLINYLQSPDALLEVTAMLNTRGYREWNYKNAEVGLPVDTRKTIRGQHYVNVEVEVIDMLFLHCCAIRWATKLNECLRDYFDKSKAFEVAPLARADADKRAFFFDNTSFMPPPPCGYTGPPCPPPPPPESKKGCRRSKTKPRTMRLTPIVPPAPHVIHMYPPPPPPDMLTDVESVRRDDYQRHFFMSRLPKHDGDVPKMTSSKDIQARLIKTLAVECKIRRAFDGEVNALTLDFDPLASTLPHCTIITVLRFLGVPDVFLSLFNRALRPKLSIESSTQKAARTMTPESGVSFGYSMEIFFSEAVLFFLDLAIRKATGSYMYRVHDHCYFVGTQVQISHAEEVIVDFSNVMGLKFRSLFSTDKLSIGFLDIDLQVNSPHGIEVGIDDSKVALYAANASLRLKSCSTVLEWVHEWNDTVGTYAAHLLGPLANVFNKEHTGMIKATYRRIYSIVLGGSDLTRWVANMLRPFVSCELEHGLQDLEPIIHLPQAYGGLGVKNPFVTIAFASNANEPAAIKIRDYLSIEAAYYTKASERYSNQMPFLNQQKFVTVFDNDLPRMIQALGSGIGTDVSIHTLPFIAKAEMMKHRERAKFPCVTTNWSEPVKTPDLVQLYRDLLDEPINDIEDSEMVEQEINRLSLTEDLKSWDELSQEDRWVLQLYNEECFERYGSLDIWWAKGIPVVVYSDLRGHLLDDDDEEHSKNA